MTAQAAGELALEDVATAATIRRAVLEPAMDATALNHEQARLIANATAECDCIADDLNEIARHPHDTAHVLRHVSSALAHTTKLYSSNQLEGGYVLQIAGFGDRVTRDLRRLELSGTSNVMPVRVIAQHLREPLAAIAVGSASTDQLVAVLRLVATTSLVLLLAPDVERELGPIRYALLRAIVSPLQDSDAQAHDPGAADQRDAARDHATA